MGEDRVRGADRPSNRERVLVARRSVRTGLIISFLALAALVRVWGLRFGLPHTECRPDESVIVGLAGPFWSRGLKPRFFRSPSRQMYLTSTALRVVDVHGPSLGRSS